MHKLRSILKFKSLTVFVTLIIIAIVVGGSYTLTGGLRHSTAPAPKTPSQVAAISDKNNDQTQVSTQNNSQNEPLNSHLPTTKHITPTTPPTGATGVCNDGSYTTVSTKTNACLNNGGVYYWDGPLSPTTYTNVHGNQIEVPDYNPVGATAMCVDGTFSHSQDAEGTCSSHGGVDHYIGATAPAPVLTCNTTQQAVYQSQNTISVDQENQRHTDALASIQSDYASRNLLFSGMYQNAVDTENTQHQQNLTNLQNLLNSQLANIHCA